MSAVDNTGKTPLHYAAAAGHPEILRYLALSPGCDLEVEDPDDRCQSFLECLYFSKCVRIICSSVNVCRLLVSKYMWIAYKSISVYVVCQSIKYLVVC